MTKVAVTGIGIVAPVGLGVDNFWAATLRGELGIGRVTNFDPTQFPCQLAGEVSNFEAEKHLPPRLLPQTDRMTRMALAAADWALEDAGVDPEKWDPFDMGVVTASSAGGFEFGQRELKNLWSKGSQHVSAYQSFAWFYAVNTGQISIRRGLKGPSGVVVSEQAGGLDALAQARRLLRRGTPLVVSGSVDASICSWGWVAQMTSGRLSERNDPARAYLPFDRDASGHVPGEGGALLILETEHTARRRGARIYGEVAGYASTFDPKPGGARRSGLSKAIEIALQDAGIQPSDIDVVFADAAGLPDLDRLEAEAIHEVFGPKRVAVTAPKTMTGRLCSGGGALDLATALLAIRDGVIPPTVNVVPDETYGLDLVVERPRQANLGSALVIARGYHGFNSAIVVRSSN